MSGGVNPLEWLLPPVALAHTAVDLGARIAGVNPEDIPSTPGSPAAREQAAAESQRETLDAARRRADRDRPQTAQEELESRQRRKAASELLGGGGRRRKASQTLTEPGALLSGSYTE